MVVFCHIFENQYQNIKKTECNTIFRDVTQCSLVQVNRRLEGMSCHHLQDPRVRNKSVGHFAYYSTLKMETVGSSELFNQPTRCKNQKTVRSTVTASRQTSTTTNLFCVHELLTRQFHFVRSDMNMAPKIHFHSYAFSVSLC
jgi:hypothetical protein